MAAADRKVILPAGAGNPVNIKGVEVSIVAFPRGKTAYLKVVFPDGETSDFIVEVKSEEVGDDAVAIDLPDWAEACILAEIIRWYQRQQ